MPSISLNFKGTLSRIFVVMAQEDVFAESEYLCVSVPQAVWLAGFVKKHAHSTSQNFWSTNCIYQSLVKQKCHVTSQFPLGMGKDGVLWELEGVVPDSAGEGLLEEVMSKLNSEG